MFIFATPLALLSNYRTKIFKCKKKNNRQFAWNNFDCEPRCDYLAAATRLFHNDGASCSNDGYTDYADTWEQCS